MQAGRQGVKHFLDRTMKRLTATASSSADVGGGGGGLEGFNLVPFGGPPFTAALPMRGCREAERCSVIAALSSPEPWMTHRL